MSKKQPELKFRFNAVIKSIDKATGKVISETKVHNTIVNSGLERIARLLGNVGSPSAFSHIALGTDDTTVTNSDTALGVEVEREAATVSYEADYKCKFEKVFSVGSGTSYSIKEVGIFDGASVSGSTMWARLNTNNTLDSDTNLSVTITYTMARG